MIVFLLDGRSIGSKLRKNTSLVDSNDLVANDINSSSITTTILVKLLLSLGISKFEKEEQGD